MMTVFVAGSIAISRLHPLVQDRIASIVAKGMAVVVGDADGADTAIQQALLLAGATSVTVYCTGETPRNNVGDWPVTMVPSSAPRGSRAFFTAKDVAMAAMADYGLMIWDARSTGTLSNVLELLARQRSSVVFVNKARLFVTVGTIDAARALIGHMSDHARAKAEDKIGLSKRLDRLSNDQWALAI